MRSAASGKSSGESCEDCELALIDRVARFQKDLGGLERRCRTVFFGAAFEGSEEFDVDRACRATVGDVGFGLVVSREQAALGADLDDAFGAA